MAKVTYHKSHTFVDKDDVKHSFITQLYQIGVYGILDGDPSMQFNLTPQDIRKIEKSLAKELAANEIKSFELGVPITVTDKSGLWEEVK